MELDKSVKLSDAIAKLLLPENKNKCLGDLNDELTDYIREIKELSDEKSINFSKLKNEISKHIDINSENVPGSISNLLISCIGEEDSCPITKTTEGTDVPFMYNESTEEIVPLSTIKNSIDENSYAILYFNGNVADIDRDIFEKFEEKGFKKIKINYKPPGKLNYTTINIENIKLYLLNKPERIKKNNLNIYIFLIAILFLSLILTKHLKR